MKREVFSVPHTEVTGSAKMNELFSPAGLASRIIYQMPLRKCQYKTICQIKNIDLSQNLA